MALETTAADSRSIVRVGPRKEMEIHAYPGCPGFDQPAEQLPAWVYDEPGLLALEQEAVFRPSWQLACHQSDVPHPGDYQVYDLLDDSVIVLRGHDGTLRAFMNACRHRAARLLDGNGRLAQTLQCPYHAWTYDDKGHLRHVPFADSFPGLDTSCYSLKPVELESFGGFVYVRIKGDGPSVADLWGDIGEDLTIYRTAEMEPIIEPIEERWDCNWKLVADNFQEPYHLPVAHPIQYRFFGRAIRLDLLPSGVSRYVQKLKETSVMWSERLYLKLIHESESALPNGMGGEWRNYSMMRPNLGFDATPDLFMTFQIIPLSLHQTMIRQAVYGLPTEDRIVGIRRYLAARVNRNTNIEDHDFCRRMQSGLKTAHYTPGPLSQLEARTAQFQAFLRACMPIVNRRERPSLAALQQACCEAASQV